MKTTAPCTVVVSKHKNLIKLMLIISLSGLIFVSTPGFNNLALSDTVSIYNGLGTAIKVDFIGRSAVLSREVAAYSAVDIEIDPAKITSIKTQEKYAEIETFSPTWVRGANHYIYNVAPASPLVKSTNTIGSAAIQPPESLGAPRWLSASFDVYFKAPPAIKSDNAALSIVSGFGDDEPSKILSYIANPAERKQLVKMRVLWGDSVGSFARAWLDQLGLYDGYTAFERLTYGLESEESLDYAAWFEQQYGVKSIQIAAKA